MIISELLFVTSTALVAAAIATWITAKARLPQRAVWAVGVAAGYVTGHHVAAARSAGFAAAISAAIRPLEARDWLPLAVLLAAGVSVCAVSAPLAWRPWIIASAALLTLALPLRLLAGSVHVVYNWSTAEKITHLGVLAATIGLLWSLLAIARDDAKPDLRPLTLAIVAGAAAIVLALSGSFGYGKLSAGLAAAIAGTAACQWLLARFRTPQADIGRQPDAASGWHSVSGAAGVIAIALGGLILLGRYYAELSSVNAALLVVSLIVAGGPWPASFAGRRWLPAIVRIMVCLVLVGLAMFNSRP